MAQNRCRTLRGAGTQAALYWLGIKDLRSDGLTAFGRTNGRIAKNDVGPIQALPLCPSALPKYTTSSSSPCMPCSRQFISARRRVPGTSSKPIAVDTVVAQHVAKVPELLDDSELSLASKNGNKLISKFWLSSSSADCNSSAREARAYTGLERFGSLQHVQGRWQQRMFVMKVFSMP